MKTEDRGLRMEDGGSGEVLGFAGVRTAPFQSARGLAQSKTWRRFGRALFHVKGWTDAAAPTQGPRGGLEWRNNTVNIF